MDFKSILCFYDLILLSPFVQKKQMMMYLTHFQIRRFFCAYEKLSVDNKMTEISKLLDFYYNGHRFNTNLMSTDLG